MSIKYYILGVIVIYCSQCGNEVGENDKFCSNCGAELNKEAAEEVNNLDKETEPEEDLNFEDMGSDSEPELLNSSNKASGCLKSLMSIAAVIVILAGLGLAFGDDVENDSAGQTNQPDTEIEQTQESEGSKDESTLHKLLSSDDSKNEKESIKEEIEIYIKPNIYAENNKLIIEGETNLIDGSLITYNITVENLEDIIWEKEKDSQKRHDLRINSMTSGDLKVENGNFKKEIDISEFVKGNLLVDLGFYYFDQPEEAKAKYGEFNQYIKGENVIKKKSPQDKEQTTKSIERSYRVTFN